MDCKRVQELIAPFVNDTIRLEDTKEFLAHIETCKECREELEVSYSIMTAMKQLDADVDMSDNYIKELDNKIQKCISFGLYQRKMQVLRRLVLAFLVFLLLFLNGTTLLRKRTEEDQKFLRQMFYKETETENQKD